MSDEKLNTLTNLFGSDKIEDVNWLHDSDILSCSIISKIESRKICAIFKYYKDHDNLTNKQTNIFYCIDKLKITTGTIFLSNLFNGFK